MVADLLARSYIVKYYTPHQLTPPISTSSERLCVKSMTRHSPSSPTPTSLCRVARLDWCVSPSAPPSRRAILGSWLGTGLDWCRSGVIDARRLLFLRRRRLPTHARRIAWFLQSVSAACRLLPRRSLGQLRHPSSFRTLSACCFVFRGVLCCLAP